MRFLLSSRDQVLDVRAENGDVDVQRCFTHPAGQNIKCLAANADRSQLIAGYFPGGVFRSVDGGAHWTDVSAGLPLDRIVSAAIDPGDPERLYVGTNPAAIFASADGGRSWRELDGVRGHPAAAVWSNPRGPAHVRWIAVSPVDSRLLFAAIEVGDLVRSQ